MESQYSEGSYSTVRYLEDKPPLIRTVPQPQWWIGTSPAGDSNAIAPVSVLTNVPRQVEEIFSPSSEIVIRIMLDSSAAAQTRHRDDRLIIKMLDTTRGKISNGE